MTARTDYDLDNGIYNLTFNPSAMTLFPFAINVMDVILKEILKFSLIVPLVPLYLSSWVSRVCHRTVDCILTSGVILIAYAAS